MEDNWGIIGHQKIIHFLKKSLEVNRLAHAYLFYGQESLGKTTVAEKFAEVLLKRPEAVATDLYKVETLEGKKDIAIEQIREWRSSLQLKPLHQGYKVGLIYGAEKLNKQSANALLKTLEEPTPQTVIILITSAWDRILPTIISRSQLIRFSPVNNQEIEEGLLAKNYPSIKVKNIVNLTGGYPGQIINFLENEEDFLEYQKFQKQAVSILDSNMAERFLAIEKLLDSVKEFNKKTTLAFNFLKHFSKVFRGLLLQNYNLTNWQQSKNFKTIKDYSASELLQKLTKIQEAQDQLLSNVQPRLVLENLFLNL